MAPEYFGSRPSDPPGRTSEFQRHLFQFIALCGWSLGDGPLLSSNDYVFACRTAAKEIQTNCCQLPAKKALVLLVEKSYSQQICTLRCVSPWKIGSLFGVSCEVANTPQLLSAVILLRYWTKRVQWFELHAVRCYYKHRFFLCWNWGHWTAENCSPLRSYRRHWPFQDTKLCALCHTNVIFLRVRLCSSIATTSRCGN